MCLCCSIISLHSIMFLLIPDTQRGKEVTINFTFHYVSINTRNKTSKKHIVKALHSIMFLLIQCVGCRLDYSRQSLHSIMFLLILVQQNMRIAVKCFTFHYVSINTILIISLFLLAFAFTFHYVSINTCTILERKF